MTDQSHQLGFFCDFDGTISENDMIAQIMMRFVPDEAAPIIERVNRRELSVRAGVEAMFALIPSDRLPEVRSFAVAATRIRAGFDRFVHHVKRHGWLLTVVSGGFDFFVEPALAPWRDQLEVFCNRIDASGETLRVEWLHPCDDECGADCGLCKPSVLRRYRDRVEHTIVIGDGVTDFEAARRADFVYARAKLLEECRRRGVSHQPFDTFDDIIAHLEEGGPRFVEAT